MSTVDASTTARLTRNLMLPVVILFLLAFSPTAAQALPGDFDPTFGTGGGTVTTDLGQEDLESGAAVDSAGRVMVVGRTELYSQAKAEAFVVRYTASGALDPTFGSGGIVRLHFGTNSFDGLSAVAIDGSGRIVVVGSTASDMSCTSYCYPVVARLTSGGQLDPTFGGSGVVTIGVNHSGASSVALDGSGRILVGTGSAVYRLTESGAFDPSFGHSGMAPVGGTNAGLAIDGAGRIVVANDFGVERLLSTGQPDLAFGTEGSVPSNIAHSADGLSHYDDAIAVDASDRIIVGGVAYGPGVNGSFVLRLTSSGALDPSFAGDGVVTDESDSRVSNVMVDGAGRYLVVGFADDLSLEGGVLIRYLPDGSFDPAFGGGFGFVRVPFFAEDVATDPYQRIVVSGDGGGEIDLKVARYLGDITPPPPPPNPPLTSPPPAGSSSPPASPAVPTTRLGKVTISGAKRIATFRFSGQGGAALTFQCQLDHGPSTPCHSPKTYRKLKAGQHVFRVRAKDALGQTDQTPAVKRFRLLAS